MQRSGVEWSGVETLGNRMKLLLKCATALVYGAAISRVQAAQEEAEAEAEAEPPGGGEEAEPLLGILDYLLLVVLGVFGVYWFFLKDKKEEPKIPAYVIQPTQMVASFSSSSSSSSSGFLSKMKNSKRRLVVFYGSQTGTAEEFAGASRHIGLLLKCPIFN